MEDIFNELYLSGKPGRTVWANQQEFLFFSGYNYLGVNHDPEFIQLITEGMQKFGWLFPSSRISNTQLSLYEECEVLLSRLTGSERTVLLPSGFTAGRVATSFLKQEIYNAPGSHPAILRNRSGISEFGQWAERLLQQAAANHNSTTPVFASDSVNPLSASIHDFSFLQELKKPATLIIDDSHGIGVTGIKGRGAGSTVPRNELPDYIFSYSLSKGFGIIGGAISCSAQHAEIIRTLPEYTASTPLSPAQVYAFIKGQSVYAGLREKLLDNIGYFGQCIAEIPGITYAAGYPVFVLPAGADENLFYRNNILISSFAYPDPAGDKLKRIVLNALHTRNDLDTLAGVLQNVYTENRAAFEHQSTHLNNKIA